jgi:hypothetical protein
MPEHKQRTSKKQQAFFKATRKSLELAEHEGTPGRLRQDYAHALDLLNAKMETEGRATELVRCVHASAPCPTRG